MFKILRIRLLKEKHFLNRIFTTTVTNKRAFNWCNKTGKSTARKALFKFFSIAYSKS
jgi:hypothetical protein